MNRSVKHLNFIQRTLLMDVNIRVGLVQFRIESDGSVPPQSHRDLGADEPQQHDGRAATPHLR